MSRKKALNNLGSGQPIRENKKKRSEMEMAMELEEQEPSSKKKLRKLADINPDQAFVSSHDNQEFQHTVRIESDQEENFQIYKQMDDQEIQKERDQQKKGKKKKKDQGVQSLHSFIQKNKGKNSQKKIKQKPTKSDGAFQLNIHDLMQLKKIKQQKRKYSDEMLNQQQHSDIDEEKIVARKMQAFEIYQLPGYDENQLIEKAKKLSLSTPQEEERVTKLSEKLKNDFIQAKQARKNNNNFTISEKKQKQKKSKPKTEMRVGPFATRQIAMTGQFQSFNKDKIIELIQKLGGLCPKTLTKKCTTLLQGSHTVDFALRRTADTTIHTTKSTQAVKRDLQVVPYNQLQQFFKKQTGKSLSQHFHVAPTYQKSIIQPKITMPIVVSSSNFYIPWTEKYKPQKLQDIIGQQSQVNMLRQWLMDWDNVVLRGKKKEFQEARGFLASGTINSRAALISGDPGLGKTTTARLVSQQLFYQISEFNASDIRNKAIINTIESNSLNLTSAKTINKSLIILDEIDGMSSGDRGGITAIIAKIKTTTVPIICICNDRGSDKIRSLAGHCYDIKFHKPNKTLLIKRLKQIIKEQGGTSADKPLQQIVQMFQNDVRQILGYLQLIFRTITKDITLDVIKGCHSHSKDAAVMNTPSSAARKLLNRIQFTRMSLRQRLDCFFTDSDHVPLMIHQNYLASSSKKAISMKSLSKATDGFVLGDILYNSIRKNQDWQLMPLFGLVSCVYPTEMVSESIGFAQFPSWLGKFSSERKNKRLIKELKNTLTIEISGGNSAVKYHYSVALLQMFIILLKNDEVQSAIEFMEKYRLTPTLINENLVAVQYNPNKANLLIDVTTATKTKMTKLYNKKHGQNKLKAVKMGKSKMQHIKYDPVLEEVEVSEDQSEEEQVKIQQKEKSKKK